MTRLACCLALGAFGVGLLPATPAAAQLSNAVKSSPNATANAEAIRAFIEQQLARLAGDDPAEVSAAREALLAELSGGNGEFVIAYVDAFANRVVPVIEQGDVLTRINAGVVADRLAGSARNGALAEAALALLKSDNSVIASYGMGVAADVVPTTLATPAGARQGRLVPAIVEAAARFEDPLVTASAYETLALGLWEGGRPRVAPQDRATAVPAGVRGMLDIMERRLAKYRDGLPTGIELEVDAVRVFANGLVWRELDPQTRERAMQAMADLLRLLARQRADQEVVSAAGGGAKINDLIEYAGTGIAATDVARFGRAGKEFADTLNAATPPARVQQLVAALLVPVETAYPQLKPPPAPVADAPAGDADANTPDAPADAAE